MIDKCLGYDKTSIASIFEYSKKLIGHSLRELIEEDKIKESKLQGQGKGGLEQMIESLFFNYPINSDPDPDFKEAGLELNRFETPCLRRIADKRTIGLRHDRLYDGGESIF